MSLAAGSKLGPYEIAAPLGADGMAESSKATSHTVKIMRHGPPRSSLNR
jgi:hypothetical protein